MNHAQVQTFSQSISSIITSYFLNHPLLQNVPSSSSDYLTALSLRSILFYINSLNT